MGNPISLHVGRSLCKKLWHPSYLHANHLSHPPSPSLLMPLRLILSIFQVPLLSSYLNITTQGQLGIELEENRTLPLCYCPTSPKNSPCPSLCAPSFSARPSQREEVLDIVSYVAWTPFGLDQGLLQILVQVKYLDKIRSNPIKIGLSLIPSLNPSQI